MGFCSTEAAGTVASGKASVSTGRAGGKTTASGTAATGVASADAVCEAESVALVAGI